MATRLTPKSRAGRRILGTFLAAAIGLSSFRIGVQTDGYLRYKRMVNQLEIVGNPFAGTGIITLLAETYKLGGIRTAKKKMVKQFKEISVSELWKGMDGMTSEKHKLERFIGKLESGGYPALPGRDALERELKTTLETYEYLLKEAGKEYKRKIEDVERMKRERRKPLEPSAFEQAKNSYRAHRAAHARLFSAEARRMPGGRKV